MLGIDGFIDIIEKNAPKSTTDELKDVIIQETLQCCEQKPADDISLVVAKSV